MDAVLHLQPLVLNLEEKIVLAENVGEGSGGCPSRLVIVLHQPLGNFTFQAPGEADKTARVLRQKFLADPWLVIKPVQRSLGGDLYQVPVSLFVLCQHEQVIVGVALRSRPVILLLANVQLASHDRLDAMLVCRIHEMHGAKNVAVIGHGHGGHAELLHALAQLFDVTSAIEQGIVGVQVQVNKLGHGSVASLTQGPLEERCEWLCVSWDLDGLYHLPRLPHTGMLSAGWGIDGGTSDDPAARRIILCNPQMLMLEKRTLGQSADSQ